MNRYGEMARRHWTIWRPAQVAQLPDPIKFFTTLGEEVEAAIQDAEDHLLPAPPTSDYLRSIGQINAARAAAEEAVLREMVLLPAETPDPEDDWLDQPLLETPGGMPTDPDHPLWAMLDDETVPAPDFQAALTQWRASLPPSRRP